MTTAALAGLLVLLCNCGQPSSQFWIEGLELPPGVRVISREERNTLIYATFSTPETWDGVKGYFDSSLKPLGYSTTPHDEALMETIRSKHPDWDEDHVQRSFDRVKDITAKVTAGSKSAVVEYGKQGSDYHIMLLDLRGAAQIEDALEGQSDAVTEPRPMYGLMVVRGDLDDVLPDD
jgi:hypothetical protein